LPPRLAEAPQAFVKFFGESDRRQDRSSDILAEVKRSGCHWACTYPVDKRPRQVDDGAIMFMGRMVRDPNDTLIYGRAVAMKYQQGRDDASQADLDARDWKRHWPHYIRVHHAEFLAGTLANGVSLEQLMKKLDSDCFEVTQKNRSEGHGNTNPRLAYRQQPAVRLSNEGYDWLNRKLQEAFEKHGQLTPAQLGALDWPEASPTGLHIPIYERLKQVAREGGLIYYGQIAPLANLDMSRAHDRNELGRIIGDISRYEQTQNRPLLSALVVHAPGQQYGLKPGNGFFALARELRALSPDQDDDAFYQNELRQIYATWHQ
jgi:hypothetical protein